MLTAACVATPHAAGDAPKPVYVIGAPAYAEAIAAGRPPLKMGRMDAKSVPDALPRSFLEADGSYAGGTVYPTPSEARAGITSLLKANRLPSGVQWEVYLLQADWRKDVYQLANGEWRLTQNALVVKKIED